MLICYKYILNIFLSVLHDILNQVVPFFILLLFKSLLLQFHSKPAIFLRTLVICLQTFEQDSLKFLQNITEMLISPVLYFLRHVTFYTGLYFLLSYLILTSIPSILAPILIFLSFFALSLFHFRSLSFARCHSLGTV